MGTLINIKPSFGISKYDQHTLKIDELVKYARQQIDTKGSCDGHTDPYEWINSLSNL